MLLRLVFRSCRGKEKAWTKKDKEIKPKKRVCFGVLEAFSIVIEGDMATPDAE